MNPPITIDVWSDVVCPWCYIGKRNLERALADYAKFPDAQPVAVVYHSYELSPDTPIDFSGTAADYLAQHRGLSPDDARRALRRVAAIGAEAGLAFDWDRVQHTNTRLAHEALHFAKEHGKQAELQERLMRAYFTEGGPVGTIADLVRYATDVGLDERGLAAALETHTYAGAVDADIAAAREYGITGVPFFAINDRWGIPGAQNPDVFLRSLERVGLGRNAFGDR